VSDKFLGFRFTHNGCNHLVAALTHNAVADNCRTKNPLPAGATVVVLAKDAKGNYVACSGTATGEVLPLAPQDVWTDWDVDTLVHGVVWKTTPCLVPAEVASRPTNNISAEHAEELAYFAFANG
jgi:hypothetical protein